MIVTDKNTQTNTLGDWAAIAIDKHLEKVIKHEANVLKDKSPEDLHQMRVGMRRLRSAITGFAPALKLPKAAQEKKIGKIARILGTLRDLDVLKAALEDEYKPSLPSNEQKALETALDDLDKQRRNAVTAVKETLHDKSYKSLKQSLTKWLQQPKYQAIAQMPIEEVLPDLLLPEVSKLLLHPGWLLGSELKQAEIETVEQLLAAEGEVLHSLRKQVKRTRYQMEVFSDFYGESYQAYLEDVKSIQEVLGKIQDGAVLADFLEKAADKEIKHSSPTLANQLAQTSYAAWQQWQNLQQRYLNIDVRKGFHVAILEPSIGVS
jgi:CHAD domain-containing protein